jgi:hypothetical protein
LPINGRKSALAERDFKAFAEHLRLTSKQYDNVFLRLRNSIGNMRETLSKSFAYEGHRHELRELLSDRAVRIGLLDA